MSTPSRHWTGGDRYKYTKTLSAELPSYLEYILKTEYGERPGNLATNEATANSPKQMPHLLYRADIANLTRSL